MIRGGCVPLFAFMVVYKATFEAVKQTAVNYSAKLTVQELTPLNFIDSSEQKLSAPEAVDLVVATCFVVDEPLTVTHSQV